MAKANFYPKKKTRTVADFIRPMMIGICRKRGFANGDILHNWSAIVGDRYAGKVQPEKIIWPRGRTKDGQTLPEPGKLVVRTDSATAVLLVHESTQLIERINTYFGWGALNGIRIKNAPLKAKKRNETVKLRSLSQLEEGKLRKNVKDIKNNKLKNSLIHLGQNLIAARRPTIENALEDKEES